MFGQAIDFLYLVQVVVDQGVAEGEDGHGERACVEGKGGGGKQRAARGQPQVRQQQRVARVAQVQQEVVPGGKGMGQDGGMSVRLYLWLRSGALALEDRGTGSPCDEGCKGTQRVIARTPRP